MKRQLTILVLLLISAASLAAQEVFGTVEFLEESIEIGRPTRVSVKITHPDDVVVVFPDSSKDFAPYEITRSRLIPTRTASGISVDSKVYYLNSWSIAPYHKLQLPVYYIVDEDTITRLTNTDSIEWNEMITVLTDSLTFKRHKALTIVKDPPNYLAIGIISCFGLLAILGVAIALYKPILKRVKIWQIDREWKKVSIQFQNSTQNTDHPTAFVDNLSSVWKSYLDKNWKEHLKSLTTSELKELLNKTDQLGLEEKEVLGKASTLKDMIVYAGQSYEKLELSKLANDVFSVMEKEYMRRKEALQK